VVRLIYFPNTNGFEIGFPRGLNFFSFFVAAPIPRGQNLKMSLLSEPCSEIILASQCVGAKKKGFSGDVQPRENIAPYQRWHHS
jgi:hypothetical protein